MVAKTLPLITLLILSGCSTISQNEVFSQVKHLSASRGIEGLEWIQSPEHASQVEASVNQMISQPLSMEDAVRITLINNRALQQTYTKIGIAQSDLVQAGLMSNPLLGYSVGKNNGVTTTTVGVDIAFLDLLWIPLRRELGTIALEETKAWVADEVLKHVKETKKAYIELSIAETQMEYYKDFMKSYESSLQLAVRQYTAGNLSKRDYLKLQDAYQRARVQSMEAAKRYAMAREALNRACGLYAQQTYYALEKPHRVLETPIISEHDLESRAIRQRFDMQAVITAVDYAAKEAGYTQNTRLLNAIEISGESEKTTAQDRFNTYGIKIPIPIFDIGQGRVSKTEAIYNQKVHELYEKAVTIRSEVREHTTLLQHSYTIAREYDEAIVKVNQQILEETQLFYNGMLDGIYELLEDHRRLIEAKISALEAYGEYQKAHADLEYTIGGKL